MTDRNHPFHVRSFVRSFDRSIVPLGAARVPLVGRRRRRWSPNLRYDAEGGGQGGEGRGAGGGGRGEASIVNEEGRSESSSGQRVYIEEWITVYASIY